MTIKQLFTLLLFVVIWATAVRPPLDPDLWWHLEAGEVILESGIPDQDPGFSFTAGDNQWFMHEWLSDLLMYLIYAVGGVWGLAFFFSLVVTLTFALLYKASVGRPYLAGLVLVLGYLAYHPFVNSRPQLFNTLFAALFIFLVEGVKNRQFDQKWLWLIPPVMLVWANLHSGFLLGFAVLGVYIVGAGLQLVWPGREGRGLTWRGVGYLGGVTAVGGLLTLLNPRGFHLWLYPFETLTSDAMRLMIAEWGSPNFHNPIFIPFLILLFVTMVSMALSRRLPTWTDWLFVLGTAFAGLQSVRHIPIFVVVVVPIIARQLLSASEGTKVYTILAGRAPSAALTSLLYKLNLGLGVLACVLALGWAGYVLFNYEYSLQESYPVAAVDYLERTGRTEARIFNHYGWGGYLIGRGVPVFIDGRADLYGDAFMHMFDDTYRGRPGWEGTLDRYGIEYALLPERSALASLLALSPEWQLLYRDEQAVVLGRIE